MQKGLFYRPLALSLGALGMLLNARIFLTSGDLVSRRNPYVISLTILSILVVVGFLLLSYREEPAKFSRKSYVGRALRLLAVIPGCFALGSMSSLVYSVQADVLSMILIGLGVIAVVALVCVGAAPLKFATVRCLCMCAVCLFFCVEVLCRFRISGNDPQIHDYIYPILAGLCLMAFSYHRAAYILRGSDGKSAQFWQLVGIFFCSTAGGIPYASAVLWLLLTVPVAAEEGEKTEKDPE